MLEAVASGAPVATSLLDGNLPDGRVFLQPQFLLKHRVATGIQTQLDKHTLGHIVSQRSTRVTLAVRWQSPQPLDEILVAEALVEGDEANALLRNELIEMPLALLTRQRQELRRENFQRRVDCFVGLAGARRAVEDLIERCYLPLTTWS
ncbi:hypothetical protein FQZ97_743710 [compost metagenome]